MKCMVCGKSVSLNDAQSDAVKKLLAEDPEAGILCDGCGARVAADAKERPQ